MPAREMFKCFWCGKDITMDDREIGANWILFMCKSGHQHPLHKNGTCDAVTDEALDAKCNALLEERGSGCFPVKFWRSGSP